MVTVAFRPLAADDFPGLVRWFAEPAVARWWGQPVDIDHVESTYRPRIEGREPTSMWIAEIDSSPSGLFQCYRHVDHPEHDACVGIPDAVGIDYLIAGTHRGLGLAPRVLRAFGAHALDQHPSTAICVATPDQRNTASWRSLERAGFARRGECHPADESVSFVYAAPRAELERHAD